MKFFGWLVLFLLSVHSVIFGNTIAFYDFEEGSDGTGGTGTAPAQTGWVSDSAGDNHGTPYIYGDKPYYIKSQESNLALSFGVAKNAIQFNNSSVFQWPENSSRTIEFFIRRDGNGSDGSTTEFIMSKGYASSGGWQIYFYRTAKTIRFQAQSAVMESTTSFEDTVWHHVAITHEANSETYELYVDYEKEAEITGYSSGSVTSAAFFVGRGYGWQELRVFNGAIDNIRISDQNLSPEQFQQLNTDLLLSFEEGTDGSGTQGQAPSDAGWIVSTYNPAIASATASPGGEGPIYSHYNETQLCMEFTGNTADYITIPDSDIIDISEEENITIELYFKVLNENFVSSPLNWLMCKGFTDSSSNGWGIYWNESDDKITFNISGQSVTSQTTINDGYWYHFAITHEASTGIYNLYIDHQFQGRIESSYSGSLNSEDLIIGRGWDWQYNRDFIGSIDEFKISSEVYNEQQFMPLPVKQIDLTTRVSNLNKLAEKLETAGQLDYYGNMRNKLVQKFLPYIETLNQDGNTELADYAEADIERITTEETSRLGAILNGELPQTYTPRRVADQMPVHTNGHLQQQVQWPDNTTETRPVFLYGFCAEQQNFRPDAEFIGNDLGCNYLQVFTGPRYVMPDESMWDTDNPSQSTLDAGVIGSYQSAIADAYNNGIITDLNISPHWIQNWFIDNHPEYYADLGGFMKYTLNQAEVKEIIGWSSRLLIEELSTQTGLWSCCIMNEPCYFRWTDDPDTSSLWTNYLQNFYSNNIATANSNWGKSYSSWTNITQYLYPPSTPYPAYPELYDWMKFNDTRIRDWALWLQTYVKAANSSLYTHIKQNNRFYTQFNVMQGSDIDLLSKCTDLPGTDVGLYSWNPSSPSNTELYGVSSTLPMTTQRTVTGRPIINSENHILRDNNSEPIEQGHVRASMWLQALSGMDAMSAWIWGYDPTDELSTGLWKNRPGATEELARTGMDLMRLMPQIVEFREKPAEVALLYSKTSALRSPSYETAISNTFDVLKEMGLQTAVITEQTITEGSVLSTVPSIKAIILPGCDYLPDNVHDIAVSLAQANSISLLGIGSDIAKYNEYCFLRSEIFPSTDYNQITDSTLNSLQTSLPQHLESLDISTDITPETINGTRSFGLYYNTAKIDGKDYITAVNTTPSTKEIIWKDADGNPVAIIDAINLVPETTSAINEYEPLEVIYGQMVKAGDSNGDTFVDMQDFAIIAKNWHADGKNWQTGDYSGDGYVDSEDLILFAANWYSE
ncbi:MAG: LamG-like jellyroll fold domain-containing protein [Sedimentisphaeraceae bacterium JB056]